MRYQLHEFYLISSQDTSMPNDKIFCLVAKKDGRTDELWANIHMYSCLYGIHYERFKQTCLILTERDGKNTYTKLRFSARAGEAQSV